MRHSRGAFAVAPDVDCMVSGTAQCLSVVVMVANAFPVNESARLILSSRLSSHVRSNISLYSVLICLNVLLRFSLS